MAFRKIISLIFVALVFTPPVQAQQSVVPIGQLPNGGMLQTSDSIHISRCNHAGCDFRVTPSPSATVPLPLSTANGGTGLTNVGVSGNVLTSNGTGVSYAPVPAATPPGSNNSSGFFNLNGQFAALAMSAGGIVTPFFMAANELYLITQGMEVDPRFYGASCNSAYFGNKNGLSNTITFSGNPITVSISGYTFNPAVAAPGVAGDVGKVFAAFGGSCGGVASTYIASVNTSNNTATLGAAASSACTGAVAAEMGGYPTNQGNPATAVDDTNFIHNASFLSATFHGGKVKLPTNCMVGAFRTPLTLAANTALEGNNGGNSYGLNEGFNHHSGSNTVMYVASDGLADDGITGINTNSFVNVALRNFTLQCGVFPFMGYPGIVLAGVGHTQATSINSEAILLDHMSFLDCPIAHGVPFGLNQEVDFTASITGTSMVVTNISTGPFPGGTTDFSPTASLAPGRPITGSGVTPGTTIVSAPTQGKVGTYIVSTSQTVTSEGMTSVASGGYTGGQSRFSSFVSNGFGMNGALSDWTSTGDVFTGNFSYHFYMGPPNGGAGNAANRIIGGREEEGAIGFVCDGCSNTQFTGHQWQFVPGGAIQFVNAWGDVQITGGMMEGNGSTGSTGQIQLGGSGTGLSVVGTQMTKFNFSGGGTSGYIFNTLPGSSVDYISLESGDVRTGFNTAVFNWAAGNTPVHYKQDAMGIPKIDTTQSTLSIGTTGLIGLGTATAKAPLDINGNSLIIETPNSPADNTTCTAGTMWWDSGFLYICTASGTVKRTTLSTY